MVSLTRRTKPLNKEQRRRAQDAFLASFAGNGNLTVAAKAAGVSRETIYHWREIDEQFGFRFNQAEAEAADVIRAAIYQRAVVGVKKYVVSMGKIVYMDGKPLTEQTYSDSLLVALAKARCPEFRDNLKITGSIEHALVPSKNSTQLLDKLLEQMSGQPEVVDAVSQAFLALAGEHIVPALPANSVTVDEADGDDDAW